MLSFFGMLVRRILSVKVGFSCGFEVCSSININLGKRMWILVEEILLWSGAKL